MSTEAPTALEDLDQDTQALGQLILTRSSEIERRWLCRVQEDLAQTPDVELTQLRNGIPEYLMAIGRLLTRHRPGRVDGAEIWSKLAREHGITRVRIGFDIDELVHEFVVLRNVIRAVAREQGVPTSENGAILADLIDAAIEESVRAYVEARDYETRRVQAEHIGFLTHELRNPLSTAVTAASMLRESAVPAQQRPLDALERSHQRLLALVEGVLDMERLQAGAVEPRRVEVREGELLDQSTEAARLAAERKGLAFDLCYVPERTILLDPDLTRSTIQNLVDNAVKYTDTGRIEVVTEDRASSWSVHVHDRCHGLSREELGTIFEPFRRGATTKRGAGLGLAIARRAIESQGGTIHAESPGAAGCHFWFTLPKP